MRIAMIGAGFGSAHLAWLSACPGVTISHLCYRRDADRAQALADRFGIHDITDRPLDVIRGGAIDAVAVVTPPCFHEEFLSAGLDAGLTVVSDKPLTHDLDGSARLAAQARLRGSRTMVTFQWRRSPALQRLRQILASGNLGRVFRAELEFHHDFLAGPATSWAWRHRRVEAGGGALADQGVHLCDLVRWLFPGDWSVLDAFGGVVWPRRVHDGSIVECDTEDVAEVLLNEESTELSARILVSRVSAGFRAVRIAVHGTTGTAVVVVNPDDGRADLTVHLADADTPRTTAFPPDAMNPYLWLAQNEEPAEDIATFDDGYAAALLLHDALRQIDQR